MHDRDRPVCIVHNFNINYNKETNPPNLLYLPMYFY